MKIALLLVAVGVALCVGHVKCLNTTASWGVTNGAILHSRRVIVPSIPLRRREHVVAFQSEVGSVQFKL